ncbi:metastasis-associated protein MTA3 isoform X3 [Ischnura elegans]|uniref:metastasis-associated protein MTA3 isoform X3 n=1 Tax=Ischnura elegans TaxID=197161 RepID=UPI001ED866CA|nr:metastasis-associated protein MTA3 isoform X3 [Ischnura elegans]
MTANMYRVGDYVYFETSSTSPYQIRRIEELNKTPNGNVEAKVMCFYRRRDLPHPLIMLADKHQMAASEESPVAVKLKKMWLKAPSSTDDADAIAGALGGGGVEEDMDRGGGGLDDKKSLALVSSGALDAKVAQLPHGGVVGGVTSVGSEKDLGKASTNPSQLLNGKQRHQLKHRELFLSRQVETLPATHIRGKCSVTLLNETESLLSYLNKDDTFFYCLVFDPQQKTLLADKGEIRVGSRYQADPTPLLKEGEGDNRNLEELETLVWTPGHHLTDRQIDQFLVISRSVGTFARALDCSSSVKQPSLHMSAAAASRDITLFHAMDTLHKHSYNIADAISSLVPSTGPVLCRDEMEEWSASEANLFEEALEKYGKDFIDIRQDFLPWKTLKNIIEYYYMWKTTDRYVQQKRVKAVEAESKLKQVYIPNYNKPNPAVINNNKGVVNGNSNGEPVIPGKACESCSITVSTQWYAWGPSHMQCKLCHNCWLYWKKYGGLKIPSRIGENETESKKKSGSVSDEERVAGNLTSHRPHRCSIINCGKEFKLKAHLARHYATAHGLAIRSGSPRPIMKTRTAFYLCSTPLTRISRRTCRHLLQPRHAARAPFWAINIAAVKQECQQIIAGKSIAELRELLRYRKKDRGSVTNIATSLGRLGEVAAATPDWLAPTNRDLLPRSDRVAFPRPPRGPDGSILYERIPNKPEAEKANLNNISPSLLKRRAYEDLNGMDAPSPAKRPAKEPLTGGVGLSVPSLGVVGSGVRTGGAALGGVGAGGGLGGAIAGLPVAAAAVTAATAAMVAGAGGVAPSSAVVGEGAPFASPLLGRSVINHLNGKAKIATMSRMGGGRKQVISWMDAPDDVYFRATEASKKMRRQLSATDIRRAARKPWRKLSVKGMDDLVVILD